MCSIGSDDVDLKANVGVVGKAFGNAGGADVHDGFKKIGGLSMVGSAFISKQVGSLSCQAILYVRIQRWNGDKQVRRSYNNSVYRNCFVRIPGNFFQSYLHL